MVQKSGVHQVRLVVYPENLQGFIHAKWCRFFSINSISDVLRMYTFYTYWTDRETNSFLTNACLRFTLHTWFTFQTESFWQIPNPFEPTSWFLLGTSLPHPHRCPYFQKKKPSLLSSSPPKKNNTRFLYIPKNMFGNTNIQTNKQNQSKKPNKKNSRLFCLFPKTTKDSKLFHFNQGYGCNTPWNPDQCFVPVPTLHPR